MSREEDKVERRVSVGEWGGMTVKESGEERDRERRLLQIGTVCVEERFERGGERR